LVDRLILISIDGRGPLVLQTVWEIDGHASGRRRRTDIEAPTSLEGLLRRLRELAAAIADEPPAAARKEEGIAAMAVDPAPALAAGELAAAA
jgi:hypothetical protein